MRFALRPEILVGGPNQPPEFDAIGNVNYALYGYTPATQLNQTGAALAAQAALQPGFALDVNVNSSSERGMLGIAVAPGSPVRVFLYYTEAQGAS